MARRRLETALQAGKAIGQGRDVPFESFMEQSVHTVEQDRDGVYSLQYSLDGSMLVIGFGDGSMEFISTVTGRMEHETRRHRLGNFAVMCIRFHPKEQNLCLAGTSVGRVYSASILDAHVDELLTEPNNEINCLDFALDGDHFATAGKDLDIRIYDSNTKQLLKSYEGFHTMASEQTAGHAQRIFSLKYHPEIDYMMITGGWDNHLKVWDTRTRDGIQRTIPGPHLCGDGLDIKGKQVLTGSWTAENSLQIWDFSEGRLIRSVPFRHDDHGEFLYCAQFCDNDVVMAGGSGTNSVQAINTNTNEMVGEIRMEKPVQALDTTFGGRIAAMAGAGTQVILAKMD